MFGYGTIGWFPLCTIFEFALGIYVVQLKLYPAKVNNSKILIFLSEISFPVFLIHSYFLEVSKSNIVYFVFSVIFISTMICLMDIKIQNIIKQNDARILAIIKNFGDRVSHKNIHGKNNKLQ